MSRSLVVVLVLAATLTAAAVPAGAQPRVGGRPDTPQDLEQLAPFADFNGDGHTDLAVGAPRENFGATVDAGAVSIFYGIATGTGLPSASQTLVQGNVEAGDQFGAALTVSNFNNDFFADLVVGAPGEDVGATVDAGAANVFLGSAAGLTTSQTLVQDNPEAGDRFGAALVTGFAAGGFIDVMVGAPGENVGATVDAGAVNVFTNTAGGLPSVSGPALLQDNPEAGDQFGAALTTGFLDVVSGNDLIVGAPGENVGATVDAGAANVFLSTETMLPAVSGPALLQDNPEAGDRFGAALTAGDFTGALFDDLVVGAPGENVGATVDAGAVNVFPNSPGGLTSVSGPALLQDNPETGDQFGAALTVGVFDPLSFDLGVGAPGENVGATVDAGAVNVFSDTPGGLPPVSGPALLQDNPEAGDQFGAALAAMFLNGGTFFELVVGAPGENVGATVDAGAVNVFANPGFGGLPSVSSQTLLQANVEAGDRFGALTEDPF